MQRMTALCTLLALAACGGNTPTGSGGATESSMAATADGMDFRPASGAITATRAGNALLFTGTQTSGNTTISVTISLPSVTLPGTLTLNPNQPSQFGKLIISMGSAATTGAWSTVLSPGSGTVTLTTVAAQRVAGTFQFTGQFDASTAATGQKSVTSGSFDLRF